MGLGVLNMKYEIGNKFKSKKNHACGGNEWEIVRTGADIKIKCLKCGHTLFMLPDELTKIIKVGSYMVGQDIKNGNEEN